jgi:hypothetical protein
MTMKIVVTRNVMVGGRPYAPGEALEVEERVGRYLKAVGKAEIVTVEVKAVATKERAVSKKAEKRETR